MQSIMQKRKKEADLHGMQNGSAGIEDSGENSIVRLCSAFYRFLFQSGHQAILPDYADFK
jgi:hypothetical protein